uniref:NADH-ubiquinone oxidoreductase chain 3 n=1 Tax=Eclysippe vanelli TaxID=479700 RepID=B3TJY1_ECLVA|nr:NADH dehydrogenase subunit 3 [Eclysippe vanelli]
MMNSLSSLVVAGVLVFAVVLMALLVGFRSNLDREKSSPFECGFDPKNSARVSFSLRFFLLAVVFLIFDIEIIFLFPIPFMMIMSLSNSVIFFSFLALLILLFGLIHEWREGSLDWSK